MMGQFEGDRTIFLHSLVGICLLALILLGMTNMYFFYNFGISISRDVGFVKFLHSFSTLISPVFTFLLYFFFILFEKIPLLRYTEYFSHQFLLYEDFGCIFSHFSTTYFSFLDQWIFFLLTTLLF